MNEVSVAADETRGLSQIERVVDTFIEPSKTFADIKRSRSWWLPFLLVTLMGYLFVGAAMQHIGMSTLAENAIKSNPKAVERMSTQTPAQQAQTISFTKGIMEGSFAGFPLIVLVMHAIFALLLWLGFAFVLGGRTNYGEMFAVSVFASLPNLLGSLAALVAVFTADPQRYNINIPSPANLGFYLEADAAAWMRALLGSLDAFTLWSLVLAGFGGAIVAKVKPSLGIVMVLAAWLLLVAVKTGFAAI